MKRIIGLGLAVSLLFSACVKDDSNHNYAKSVLVSITGMGDKVAYIGEPITITPVIDYNGVDESEFEYAWYAMGKTISTDRDLTHSYTNLGTIPHVFAVTHKSGFTTTKFFNVVGSANYTTGWLILSNRSGESVLHYARPGEYTDNGTTYQYQPYRDMYSNFNDNPLGNNPRMLAQTFGDTDDEILVIQDEPVWVSGVNFKDVISLRREWLSGDYPSGFQTKFGAYTAVTDCVGGTDGRLYFKYSMAWGYYRYSRFGDVPLSGVEIDWAVSTALGGVIAMYDRLNKKMIILTAGMQYLAGSAIAPTLDPGTDPDFIDPGNLGDAKIMKWDVYKPAGSAWDAQNTFVAIVKSGPDYYLQKFNLATSVFSTPYTCILSKCVQKIFMGNDIVSDNSLYMPIDDTFFLFTEKNILYLWNENLIISQPYYTFPAGTTITQLVQNPSRTQMGVALDNGEFYVIDTAAGSLAVNSSSVLFKMTGLGDIVHVIWKYGNSTNYSRSN